MSDGVSGWLEQLGLGRYRQAFAENHIEERILLQLTDADLKELGVASLGHRKILLQAITALREEQVTEAAPGAAAEVASPVRDSGSHDAERRQLTIMFCDLAGSTELSQQLDPEDLREVNRSYQDAVKSAIEHFGGYVARYMGDGVLAYFGYPMAHEDDAERAVRAGLLVVETMDRFNARTGQAMGAELAVRVGIATGPVVVGDLIGEGASQESAVVGETPNLAARLQGLARRNTVVIAPGTKRLAGRMFDYRDLG
ncbi:MAG TPA: adenylate/guanylate cyclase domain-containing protein, partial [Gammaproteobacteria bacterium]